MRTRRENRAENKIVRARFFRSKRAFNRMHRNAAKRQLRVLDLRNLAFGKMRAATDFARNFQVGIDDQSRAELFAKFLRASRQNALFVFVRIFLAQLKQPRAAFERTLQRRFKRRLHQVARSDEHQT